MRFRERARPETMGTGSPIDAWRFLLGTWRGASQGQFGETGIVESEATFTGDLGDRFLVATGEATCEGRLLNRSLQVLFYDTAAGKFRRKTFFSYGFVNNEVEYARTEDEIRFEVEAEPRPRLLPEEVRLPMQRERAMLNTCTSRRRSWCFRWWCWPFLPCYRGL